MSNGTAVTPILPQRCDIDMFCCSVFTLTDKQEKIVSKYAGDRDMKALMSLNHKTLANYRT